MSSTSGIVPIVFTAVLNAPDAGLLTGHGRSGHPGENPVSSR